jgi:hypothetical protein
VAIFAAGKASDSCTSAMRYSSEEISDTANKRKATVPIVQHTNRPGEGSRTVGITGVEFSRLSAFRGRQHMRAVSWYRSALLFASPPRPAQPYLTQAGRENRLIVASLFSFFSRLGE